MGAGVAIPGRDCRAHSAAVSDEQMINDARAAAASFRAGLPNYLAQQVTTYWLPGGSEDIGCMAGSGADAPCAAFSATTRIRWSHGGKIIPN